MDVISWPCPNTDVGLANICLWNKLIRNIVRLLKRANNDRFLLVSTDQRKWYIILSWWLVKLRICRSWYVIFPAFGEDVISCVIFPFNICINHTTDINGASKKMPLYVSVYSPQRGRRMINIATHITLFHPSLYSCICSRSTCHPNAICFSHGRRSGSQI